MKSLFDTTKVLILALALSIGVSSLFAQNTFTPPTQPAPLGNVDAPINASTTAQFKRGALSIFKNGLPTTGSALDVGGIISVLGALINGPLTIFDGTQGAGKILTSDATGRARWEAPAVCTPGSSGLDTFTNSGTWNVPAGVTSIKVKVWGAGGNGGSGAPSYAAAGSAGGGGGGGGGAGGYAEKTITIPSGTTSYQVVVGTPGTTGFSAFDSSTVKATNGTSAVNHTGNESTGGAGGAGGVPVGTYVASQSGAAGVAGTNGTYISGCPGGFSQDGNGGNGGASYSPSTGGIGGVLPNCSQTGPSGTTGTIGGGGGGGAGYGGAGGVGGAGRVVIEYSGGGSCGGTPAGGSIADSGNLTIPNTNATSVSWSHGFGQKPGFVRLVLVSLQNQSSAQGSYLAGDELDVSTSVFVGSGGNYVSVPMLVTTLQVILPHQWASYPLSVSANRTGAYDTMVTVDRSTWAIKIYAGTSVGSSAGVCDANPISTITQSNSGTQYQNTTGGQLMVVATASETSFSGQNALAGYIGATSASTLVSQEIFTSTNRNSITFLVPPGYYYKVLNGATNSPTLSAQVWKLCGGGTSTGGGDTLVGVKTGYRDSAINSSISFEIPSGSDYGILAMSGAPNLGGNMADGSEDYEFMDTYLDFSNSRSTGKHIHTLGPSQDTTLNYTWEDRSFGSNITPTAGDFSAPYSVANYGMAPGPNFSKTGSVLTISHLSWGSSYQQSFIIKFYKRGAGGGTTGGTTGNYSMAYIGGSGNYNYPIICRMNTSNGVAECKHTTDVLSSWVSITSPFPTAVTAGSYSISCIPGSGNYNYTSCCRLNAVSGSMLCKTAAFPLTTWTDTGTAF